MALSGGGLSAYSGNTGLIDNYINPILGEYNIQDINRRVVDRFILELQKTAPVNTQFRKARTETLPPCTIEKICKVMHCAFRQAVRWDMIPKNPFDDVLLPKKGKEGTGHLDSRYYPAGSGQLLRRKAVYRNQSCVCLLLTNG